MEYQNSFSVKNEKNLLLLSAKFAKRMARRKHAQCSVKIGVSDFFPSNLYRSRVYGDYLHKKYQILFLFEACYVKSNLLLKHEIKKSGPSCSKLTTSLVNDSLKYAEIFCRKKMWVAFAVQKLPTFFSANISEYCILNSLKQLTTWPLTSSLS